MRTEVEVDLNDHRLRVVFDFYLARPAPACSNPDSPAFSDPGDPGEVDILAAFLIQGKRERKLSDAMIAAANSDDKLLDDLYMVAVECLPNE